MKKKFPLSKFILIGFISMLCNDISFSQTFTRITSGLVVNTVGDSRSVNWIDVNNDSLIDLFISNGKTGGQNNLLYINDGGGVFTRVTNDPIVMDSKPSDGATFGDCDNDGDLDAFVVNWYLEDNLFYTNDGAATFTKHDSVVVVTSGGYSETAAWGDYDNDGLLDLYITRSGSTILTRRNQLYHNDGGNVFTKILTGSWVTDAFTSRSVNWTDMDSDGDLDLFVTNEGTTNLDENIYRNDNNGVFTKITSGALISNGAKTMSGSWGDYDNDGDLDVFLANDGLSNALFRNEGNFVFTKIISDTVSNTNDHSFSSAWSDIDNDGDLDLFVTNSFWTNLKQLNFLYTNNGNGSFTRVNNTSPATDSSWSYGCAFGDYDNDGFEDLAVATVTYNGVDENDLLYHNDGNSNKWITFKLIGTITNKSAIGTKVRIKANINGIDVWQMREVSSQSSYCGQNDLRVHFGLGDATMIDSVKVEWLSGTIDNFVSVNSNQFLTLTEGQSTSVNEIENSYESINVYPNPTTGKFTVSSGKKRFEAGSVISIADLKGREVFRYKIQIETNSIDLDLNNINPELKGSYTLIVRGRSGKSIKKIIKF